MTEVTTVEPRPDPSRVDAPWTPEQVETLNICQASGIFHPFTSEVGNELVATSEGWIEVEGGPVVQTWAHSFMMNKEAILQRQEEMFGALRGPSGGSVPPKMLPEAIEAYDKATREFPFEHTFIEDVDSTQQVVDLKAVNVWLEENIGPESEDWVSMGGDPAGVAYQYRFKKEDDLEKFQKVFGDLVL